MVEVITLYMAMLLVLMATLLPEVTVVLLSTPSRTKQGMFILLVYQLDFLQLLVGGVISLAQG